MATKRNRIDGRTRISWLHLSDLHVTKRAVGGKPMRRLGLELWDEIRRAFFTDLERQIETLRLVPDLVLITGDLACSGERQQYEDFDAELLLPLLDRLRSRGGDPVVFAVPGNHDVKRPMKLERAKYDCLSSYDARDDEHPTVKLLREALWAERDGSFLAPLFANYQAWAERTMHPTLGTRTTPGGMLVEGLHTSHVPGDLSVLISRDELRLLLVGLNSAWIQYDGGDFTKKLHVPLAQLHAALAKDEPLVRFDGITTALLLLHHPPVLTSDHGHPWLSKTAKDEFDRYVHPATEDRFAACLFGHMHEARAQMRAGSGAAMRYFYQSPSLFGLEKYAERAQRLDVGYTLGALYEDREIRLWVRRWTGKDSGAAVFSPDHELHLEEDGSFALRPGAPRPCPPPRRGEPKGRARKTARTKAGTTPPAATSPDTGLGQAARELADVLAKVVHDPEIAKTMAMRAGFPGEHLPAFKTAIAFWSDIVEQSIGGRLGLDALVKEAVDQFPHNSRLLAVGAALGRAAGAHSIHPPEAVRASDVIALREWFLPRHETIKLISPSHPIRCPFDEIYIPLQVAVVRQIQQPGKRARMDARVRDHGAETFDIDLPQIFPRARALEVIVRGEPGAGKTTTLEKIAHTMLVDEGGRAVGLPDAVLPLLLPLRRLKAADLDQPDALLSLACSEATASDPQLPVQVLERLWRRGKLLLLLDGLDEIADPRLRERLVRHVVDGAPARRRRGVRCLVSSRFSGITATIDAALDEGFLRVDVQPLRQEHIEGLVRHWFRAVMMRGEAPNPNDDADCRRVEHMAQAHATRLIEDVRKAEDEEKDGELRALVGTPLILTLLCSVAWVDEGRVPRERGEFYRRCLEVLLRRPRSKDPDSEPPVDEGAALRLLRVVAHSLHEAQRRDGLGQASLRKAMRSLRARSRSGAPIDPAQLLSWLCEQAGVLTNFGDDDYGFAHLTFQEYLTAAHVDAKGGESLTRLADRFGEPWWQEVILLCLASEREDTFDVFMRRVLAGDRWLAETVVQGDDPDPRIRRRAEAPWNLLQRCWNVAVTRTARSFLPSLREPSTAAIADMRWKLLGLLKGELDAELLAWAARVANDEPRGGALADAALDVAEEGLRAAVEQGVDIDETVVALVEQAKAARSVTETVWVEETTGIRFLGVPGGDFVMGSEAGEPEADDDERPAHRVTLRPFMLAETPVTNTQYGVFMRARPNVEAPKYWRDRRFSGGDQPVVGVSWNDAQAFCSWLAEMSGRKVRLPSEAQWEHAARGTDQRRYPWGNEEPDESRACYDQSWETGQPAPVGRYPHGRGPFGHLDLAGNVWEWCEDTWDERAYHRADLWSQTDPVVKHGDGGRRVCRGGAWLPGPAPAGRVSAPRRGRRLARRPRLSCRLRPRQPLTVDISVDTPPTPPTLSSPPLPICRHADNCRQFRRHPAQEHHSRHFHPPNPPPILQPPSTLRHAPHPSAPLC